MKFLLVVIVFAAAVYLLVRMLQDRGLPDRGRGAGGLAGPPRRPRPPGPPSVKGPDDDEDFLRDLDRERRKRRAEPDDSEG